MRYKHRDGETATGAVTLTPVRDNAAVDENGVFEVDEDREDFDEVHERLIDAGHEPLEGGEDESEAATNGSENDGDDENEKADGEEEEDAEVLQASDFTETELVEMDRQDLRSIAAHYDDINGNASAEKLTEKLIQKRREETEAE